ncbi:hypothetical protein HDV03_002622 [Kappamyces sp. JEL0829]|nr:hypothetical protein HDV03_002622 [Kappamyces sp. JEL0829]KAJ3351597.1 hypothetical protein HDU91_006098 [Kappamyces sp. JEL0680]
MKLTFVLFVSSLLAQSSAPAPAPSSAPSTGNAQVDSDIQAVHQDHLDIKADAQIQQLKTTLKNDRKALKEKLRGDLTDSLKASPQFIALKADEKAMHRLAKDKKIRQQLRGLLNGTLTTSGDAELDAAFAKVKSEKNALLASNADFKKLEDDKAAGHAALKTERQTLNANGKIQKLKADKTKLKQDAKAAGVQLHHGKHHHGKKGSNATATGAVPSAQTTPGADGKQAPIAASAGTSIRQAGAALAAVGFAALVL